MPASAASARAPLLLALALCGAAGAPAPGSGDFHGWATTPPMGWNSWDCFATTLTEAQARAQADVMVDKLAAHGWQYVVVDVQWYEPGATGYGYHAGARLTLDGNGRLLPAPNKFPGAHGGAGFRPLADYVHAKGLKLGIHLMRGIPRQAVSENLPIAGTPYHAADIADRLDVCEWNSDMYGVDMSRPGAQAYYDSVFALIASWGVDFVKMDDIARPTIRNEPEIEAVRAAIDRCGRAMVLSLSPGETDISAAAHVAAHANMWRISDDFWDHWSLLRDQFERLNQWSRWRAPGAWPDADMIPMGTIDMGRKTWFSHDEQVTLMTLWCVARSPLMVGADLTRLDGPTLALLTNDEVLQVNQASANNRQLFRDGAGGVGWIADAPGGRDRYVALFNTRDPWILDDSRRIWLSATVDEATPGQAVPFDLPVAGLAKVVLAADAGKSPRFWWPSIFREVRWVYPDGREAPADREYGSHGEKVNGIDVPPGAARLRGVARLDDEARRDRMGDGLVFSAYGFTAADLAAPSRPVDLDLENLGLGRRVRIRDLWAHRDLGAFSGTFSPEIEWHGARLYRASAAP
jgi:hypothetical protein